MAEVGSVYDTVPAPRTPADIMPGSDERDHRASGPTARNKWLVASVVKTAASVVKQIFDEADRRDPRHQRTWVALVDGNNHQLDLIRAEARARQIRVPIVIDFIHVLCRIPHKTCYADSGIMPSRYSYSFENAL